MSVWGIQFFCKGFVNEVLVSFIFKTNSSRLKNNEVLVSFIFKTNSSRLKNNAALVEGTDYEKVKVAGKGQRSDDSISKIEFDIAADSAGSYKCQGTQYDDFCTTQEEFVSEEVVLSIISATPLENPQVTRVTRVTYCCN